VTQAEIAALEGGDLDILSTRDRALIDYATEVLTDVSPSDATLAAARSHYPDGVLFDTIVLIGSYMITARIAAVGGVEFDPEPVVRW
jgi:4-carboxymuconolactone decarboxylase